MSGGRLGTSKGEFNAQLRPSRYETTVQRRFLELNVSSFVVFYTWGSCEFQDFALHLRFA